MTLPRDPQALARMVRGMAGERPIPAYLECSTFFEIPDRLIRSPLSASAKLVGISLCAECRDRSIMATGTDNATLGRRAQLSPRQVQRGLVELESARLIFRLDGRDELGLDTLRWAGYRDPWQSPGSMRPSRAIVLLWRLPHPDKLGPVEHVPSRAGRPDAPIGRAEP